ncbi:hypothetical protein TraAM80_06177 [Trypanosoma rangeli]|uniref:Uncharacterized protein n=1 Tax=Trypanosoma rangeli TaxID=5698 RepID=A0A422NBB5_TRYRA|nr:uncharacterized protein TraAM80_06177 [Trypanosoma rangeli]RNF02726.1 hypothetical protein TraAM80_06177 [Trypanosoma rangeli]|eukprot:RNF02726.1 hypothetical protein TraAM80_06177 [Trypanosoma rangeli]
MAKKHRVKRQKYVEHLRRLEKERDEYLAKRMRSKRSRAERNEEDIFGEAKDNLVMGERKRERKEAPGKDQAIVPSHEDKARDNKGDVFVDVKKAESKGKDATLPAAKAGGRRLNRKY